MNPSQATEEFIKIADASCNKAQVVGVVEKSIDPNGFTLVMVPKDQAYKDFSAAYFEPNNTYELIWEADALSACSASISFSLAKEAGVKSDIVVNYHSSDGSFETTQDLGEYGTSHIRYTVDAGLLSATETLDSDNADERSIKYGNLSDGDWRILKTAVDAFLTDQ
ncbi:hypothetical protein [Rhodoluna sp.]|uniref:hypothetical protein n=1 Tax=Rhodoluna sp. TaxID=1969481 RepID=UPI0025ECED83|nr:hypothetical protein [Rhodoluna sp.]